MLPIDIQMQIDITAQMHKREIAEGFAKLRENLTPKQEPSLMTLYEMMCGNYLAAPQAHALASIQNRMLGLWQESQNLPPSWWYRDVGSAGNRLLGWFP